MALQLMAETIESDHCDIAGDGETELVNGRKAPAAIVSLPAKTASGRPAGRSSKAMHGHGSAVLAEIARPNQRIVDGDAGLIQRDQIAIGALIGGRNCVRTPNVRDSAISVVDQVTDGPPGGLTIVDIDGCQGRVAADHDGGHAIDGHPAGEGIADDAGGENDAVDMAAANDPLIDALGRERDRFPAPS